MPLYAEWTTLPDGLEVAFLDGELTAEERAAYQRRRASQEYCPPVDTEPAELPGNTVPLEVIIPL
jgi:hypothetical protein